MAVIEMTTRSRGPTITHLQFHDLVTQSRGNASNLDSNNASDTRFYVSQTSVSTCQMTLAMNLIVFDSLAFTKGVTCLSKYGDEMYIFASAECLILSATNTAETSFCRFQYSRIFFTRYNVGLRGSNRPSGSQDPAGVSGQVLTKVSWRFPCPEMSNDG